jgi:large repetitive protein
MQGDMNNSFANQIVRIECSSISTRKLLSPGVRHIARYLHRLMAAVQVKRTRLGAGNAGLLMAVGACIALTGCGAGGYAGNGITSLSSSAITIDAGQSFQIAAKLTGDEPVSWTLAGASCSAAACGSLSSTTGATVTYTAPAGITTQRKVTLTAATSGTSNSSVAGITVNPDPVISGAPQPGTVATAYSATLSATGGTAPLTWSMVGSLPAGLTFNPANGVISGTPTTAGSVGFSAQILDSSDVPYTAKAPETIAISTSVAHLDMISGNPPAGTVGTAYSTTLGASGGTTPYSFSVTSGSLPSGLTIAAASGVISGTPTVSGTSVFTGQVEDASSAKASASFSITINAGTNHELTLSSLPGATVGVPYNSTIAVTGGTAPYSCLQTGGSLPAGLILSASCVVSGTPITAGTSPFTVKATDSSGPARTGTGPESITVGAAASLTLTSPPNATVGTPYSAAIGVGAGTPPYSCVIVGGTLPAGLTLGSGCIIAGTPATAGTSNLTVTAVDSSAPIKTITGPVSLTVLPSGLTLALSTLPGATVGVAYSATIGVSGGTAPYTCLQTGGALPAGLSLSVSCVVSGTPTTAGTTTLQVKATDSSSPAESVTGPESITVAPAGSLTISSPPTATVGAPYSGTIGVSGGTTPYSCAITAGTLPAGLTLGAGCVITGTPTTAGTSTVTVKATDTSTPSKTTTGPVTLTVNPSALSLTLATLPGATVGVPYSATIGVSGGTAPYTCLQTGGALPVGLVLSASCVVSGTPATAGTSTVQVKATDSSSPAETVTGPESITVAAAGSLTITSPPSGTVGTPYSGTIGVSGGTTPYSCVITAGTLPAGLTLGANCIITGTPTTAGTTSVTVKATDTGNPVKTTTSPIVLTVNPSALTLTLATLPGATVGVPYSATIGVSGGTSPYACRQVGGALPAGLTLYGSCVVSGTPTTAGTSTAQVKATDSSVPVETVTGPESITVSPAPLTLTLATLPGATVGVPYSATIGVSGGTSPYACSKAGGTLPAGLALSASCVVSGTPTAAGTSTVQVKATDSSTPVETVTGPETITVTTLPLTLTLATLPGATVGVPYNATIGVSGGTSPYACSLTAGTLPHGLTLSASCVVSGTPTVAGTSTVQVKATDSSTPVETVTGPENITVSPAPLVLTLATLPGATVGVPYSATIGVSGGTPPYNCSIVTGTLPAGLTLKAACVVSGTPTTPETSTVQVKATDSGTPAETVTGPETITVSPAPLTLTISSLPNATVGSPYTATIGVSGGTPPYSCSIVAGTLPAGLTLKAACVVSGTPTVAGSVILSVKATDTSNPVETTTGPVGLTVVAAPPTLTLTSPPNATVDVPYSGTIVVTGGKAPYACTITAGTLPPNLTMSASCVITGTPTTAGTTTVTVKATDSSTPAATTTGPVTITVLPATATLTLSSPPNATVSVPYTGTIGVAGGTAPYNCALVTGTLPAGLSLGAGCALSGTPTVAGTSTVTIHATDSATPTPDSVTGPVSITVSPISTLSLTGSLPNATLGVPYTQTLVATGGLSPYKYTLTAGALPPGLTLSIGGTISGTPTAVGASSFTVTVTDTETKPQTASLPLVLLVVYPATTTDSELIGPYAFLFQGYDDVLAGVLAYQTATVASFTADGTGVISDGELDSNHQSSKATGAILSSQQFLGTYTLGTNNLGYMTITTLAANGTTAGTATYAITVKAPVAPATVAAQADMIEYDGTKILGTRGSGTMLAQEPAAFSAGLQGSYAFGLSGDTPCLPACTVGIIAGPVASVGQFTTDGTGLLTSGASDANIATKNYADALLTGKYAATDGNGRLQLTMDTAGTPVGIYPTDYAVYLVNANQAFVMSNDKHSTYLLLAGTAQLQTQPTFNNASLTGAFVGYENAQSDPGLLGTTLGDVLNLSTATIFRATGNTTGTCNFTNVDVAGLTGLVNKLTGLGGKTTLLNALLGTYQSTGTSACTVAANGRGVLNYPAPNTVLSELLALLGLSTGPPPPREFYLISPDSGYFLETGYAGLGKFELQSGAPATLASLDGTYVYASQPAASLASINTSGTFVANGTGSAITNTDLNVGVGNLNLLQADSTTTSTYYLTDATAERFVFNTTVVIYEIEPGRFVLVDTNVLDTSPSISLLY